ncbi:MAG: FtsW/RodA/SpoVE family cell cycle protein [Lachnospiraceae bacterium]|nr:FtsW/RodA/SpoVE family cell cycle protein [Lachnospiraceae bacterium]
MFAFDRYRIRNFNLPLMLVVAALSILGFTVLQSAVAFASDGPATTREQLLGFMLSSVSMLGLTLIDYHFWLKLHGLIWLFMMGILGLVFTPLGQTWNGATRWLKLPGIGSFQPSEFAKVMMILFFAWFFGYFQEKINKTSIVFLALAFFGAPAVLIFLEPDLSTTGTFALIFLVLIFVAGISWKWIGRMALAVVPFAGFLVWDSLQENPRILKRYMLNRILGFLNPDNMEYSALNNQQAKAAMAIASGKLHGKGLFNADFNSVKNGNFLSEENCDFIFAVVGEELGFIGTCAVILMFALLVFLCFRAAAKARDLQGRIICAGVGTLIGLQVFINIGVCSGLLPNTGVVLPFFSAGLSSLVCTFTAIGLVMNVSLQRRTEEDQR